MWWKRHLKQLWHLFQQLRGRYPQHFIYVALGDSTVEGLGASHPERSYAGILALMLKESKKNVTFHNLGENGAQTLDVIEKQLNQAIAFQPNLITISIGANDIKAKLPPPVFESRLQRILTEVKKGTTADIVINTIPDLSLTPKIPKRAKALTRVVVWQYNLSIKRQAKQTGVHLVDLFTTSRFFTRHYPELLFEDNFHPSDFGYALWANTIAIQIPQIIYSPQQRFFLH